MALDAAVTPFSLPLRRPLRTARGTVARREGALFGVTDGGRTVGGDEDHGNAGVGEATPLPGWTESLPATYRALADARAALARDGWAAAVAATAGSPAARHAVTLARADRAARRAGVPLYRHLGADEPVDSVPVNATVGDAPPDATAERAADAVAAGFDCVKLKVGARSVAADRERLRAVRERIGESVELRADANGAWDRTTAQQGLDALAEFGVAYVEQPLPPNDLVGHAALRGGPVDVALDESLAARGPGIDAALVADTVDAVVLKPMALGGVGAALAAARRARDAGVTPVVTTTVDAVVARTAAVHLAAALDDPPAMGLATADRLAADLGPDPAPVADGRVRVPQAKGTGVRLAESRR